MVLATHIIIALSSLAFSTYTFFRPSEAKLRLSYVLAAAVIISGSYLVYLNPAALPHLCSTGLIYLGVVTVLLVAAHRRLVAGAAD
ncbi:MAG TPA: hypothetical protein VLF67_03175 [Candidatus Saccharimonas sp.]|nr:hypothetical protein [Candidatus Saccharimonas sp.]